MAHSAVPLTLPIIFIMLYIINLGAIETLLILLTVSVSLAGAVLLAGLVPILWSTGTGSDVMKRIAAPMVGGIALAVRRCSRCGRLRQLPKMSP